MAREILFPFLVHLLKPNYSYGPSNLHFHRFLAAIKLRNGSGCIDKTETEIVVDTMKKTL